ncbi:MAG: AMP-binding protein [Herbaspirillum sp.]|nr:AMP-binding protein [Herbaspirillum sp.]
MHKAADMLRLPYAACAADATVAYRDGQALDNRRFRACTAAWHDFLAARPGRKFALFINDSFDFSTALYGAWLAGKTVYLPGDALHATCVSLSAGVDGFLGDFDAEWSPLTLPPTLPLTLPISQSDAGVSDTPALVQTLDPDFDGLVVYTSGSSGDAQAIPKRLSQLASEVATLEQLFGAGLGDADVLATVSHQHIYGLLFKVLWPLAAQRPLHVRSAAFLEELLPHMRSRPCLLVSSPAHLKRFPDRAIDVADSAMQLRAVFSSGGPLSAEAAEATRALLGVAPIEIYGSSETGGIAARSRDEPNPGSDNDSWTPMPGVQWRVDAADGLLEVRSPHLRDTRWLRMADRAAVASAADGQTRFVLQGRADRIVKLEEKRISLDAMERGLCASPLVTEARVVLHASGKTRTGMAAFVVLSDSGRAILNGDGKPALDRQLRALLAAAVEAIALPRRWRYLDRFPVNAQGKTTQAELSALLASAPARPTMPEIASLQRGPGEDPHRVELALRIPADLLYFDGHFGDTPILPGVVQLDWAIAFGRRYFDMPPLFGGVHALKFQQVIAPESTVMLELQYDAAKTSLSFRMHSAAGQHASGRIAFVPAVAAVQAVQAASAAAPKAKAGSHV